MNKNELNILVLSEGDVTEEGKGNVYKNKLRSVGAQEGRIIFKDKPFDALYEIKMRLANSAREQIHLLICEIFHSDNEIIQLVELIRRDIKENLFPYITIIIKDEEGNLMVRNARLLDRVNKISRMEAGLDYGDMLEKVCELLSNQKNLLSEQKPKEVEFSPEQLEKYLKQEHEKNERRWPMVTASEEDFCYYDELPRLPDLTGQSAYPLNNCVAGLFDMDGTLVQPYVMLRFVRELLKGETFSSLLQNHSEEEKKRNEEGSRELRAILEEMEDKELIRPPDNPMTNKSEPTEDYEKKLERMNRNWAKMLAGIDAREVGKIGNRFSLQDSSIHSEPYALPVMKLINFLGIIPTLVTGIPAEMLFGYRKRFGIIERCYPLLARTDRVGDKLVYCDTILNHGGLFTCKEEVASRIKNGNEIYFHMGDQLSDLSPMRYAMLEKNDTHGRGFFITDESSEEGRKLANDVRMSELESYRRGYLVRIDKILTPFRVLELVACELNKMLNIRHEYERRQGIQQSELQKYQKEMLNLFSRYPKQLKMFL